MSSEAVSVARQGSGTGVSRPSTTLTRRASLNAVQSLLDYSAKLAVGIVLVPILVTGLGRSLYGVWEMLGRLVGYIGAADGRPTQALRLTIANQQSSGDHEAKRRQIGSALVVWLICLPLVVVVGVLVVWLAPTITRVPPALYLTVRVACALLIGGFLLTTFATIPESVLRGMNIGYKRMGLQAGLSVVAGCLMAGVIYAGFGLMGVAGSQIVIAGLTGLCFWLLVRKYLPWFGVARPVAGEVRSMLRLSLWVAAGDLIAKLLLASDVLILGMVVSTSAVTSYVLTGYAARLTVNLHVLTADAVMPGLAGIIGQRSFDRAAILRSELLTLTWLFVTVAGATILLWNRSFIHLWIGDDYYAGFWPNLLIVLIAVQTALIRADAYILDAALQPRLRVIVSAVAAAVTLTMSLILARSLGIVGLCLGVLAGRATQTVCYPILVRACLQQVNPVHLAEVARPLLVTCLLFFVSAYLGRLLVVESWAAWAPSVVLSAGAALLTALVAGLSPSARTSVIGRLVAIRSRARG